MSLFSVETTAGSPCLKIALTAQEKKVIGFVLGLFLLGLAVLGFRRWFG